MIRAARALCACVLVALALSCGSSPPAALKTETALTTATATPSPALSTAIASLTPASGSVTVQLAEHFFSPSLVTIKVGTTVTWVDVGQQQHDVHARDGSFNSPQMGPGNTFKFTFTKVGKFPYYCAPHEGDGMIGEVDVVD